MYIDCNYQNTPSRKKCRYTTVNYYNMQYYFVSLVKIKILRQQQRKTETRKYIQHFNIFKIYEYGVT